VRLQPSILFQLLLIAVMLGVACAPRQVKSEKAARGPSPIQRGASVSRLSAIVSGCAAKVGADGFGDVNISEALVAQHETGEIDVPCRLHLKPGASMVLRSVTLTTRHLIITDDAPNGRSLVTLDNSTLEAKGSYGFELNLSDSPDAVVIKGSRLDYPLSVWIRVFGQTGRDLGGHISVTGSKISSLDPSTDGIQLIASESSGIINLKRVEFRAPSTEKVFLFAKSCKKTLVTGAPEGDCGQIRDAMAIDQGGSTSGAFPSLL